MDRPQLKIITLFPYSVCAPSSSEVHFITRSCNNMPLSQNLNSNQPPITAENSIQRPSSMNSSGSSSSLFLSGSTSNEVGNITTSISKIKRDNGEENTKNNNAASSNDELFKLEMAPLKKLNINIPQKRTISMLSEEVVPSPDEDSTGNLLTCSVCFEEYNCSGQIPLKEPLFLECHHTLCRGCVLKVFQRPAEFHKCPLCRAKIQKKNCLQKNFYVEAMLNKRRKSINDLTVWCKDCKSIAKLQCANHEFQEISEAVCYLWKTNNDLWKSLTGIIADLSQSCKLSHEASASAYDHMLASMTDLIKVVQGLELMFQKLLQRKRSVCSQMETLQNEIKLVEPYIKKFDSIVSWRNETSGAEVGASSSGTSSTPDGLHLSDDERRVKSLRHLPHAKKVNLAKQIRTVMNMLNEIEKYTNIAVNNREALNLAITTIDTEQMKKLVIEKLHIVLKSVEKTFEDFDPVLHENIEGIPL